MKGGMYLRLKHMAVTNIERTLAVRGVPAVLSSQDSENRCEGALALLRRGNIPHFASFKGRTSCKAASARVGVIGRCRECERNFSGVNQRTVSR